MKIIAPKTPSKGQVLTIHGSDLDAVGNAAPIFVDGRRVALGRIVEDLNMDPRYAVQVHGSKQPTTAKGYFRVEVETVYE